MKIKGTEWYTANGIRGTRIEGSERSAIQVLYGYRMPLKDRTTAEIIELRELLKSDGINTKLKTSKHEHTGIPAGVPFLEVLDEDSAIALEKTFLKQGIQLPTDRYKEYGLEYIKRTPDPVVIKTIWDNLFGRK